jgi:DNA-binding transcriptional MerR regulator
VLAPAFAPRFGRRLPDTEPRPGEDTDTPWLGVRSNPYGGGMGLSVSELASRAGITADTVRYYGRLGLLPETGRTAAGHRYYDNTALERLRFIKGAQWFELRLEEIRELLEVFDAEACPCGHTREVVLRRIAAIDEQRGRLDEIRAALCRLLGDDATATPTRGHAKTRSDDMTDTLTTTPQTTEAQSAPCGCCIPPPVELAAEVRELQARKQAVERRLAGLGGGARP